MDTLVRKTRLALPLLLAAGLLLLGAGRLAAGQGLPNVQFPGSVPTAPANDPNAPDPPSRVARLGFMQGNILFQPMDDPTWVAADPNRPLTNGDSIWTDAGARGEIFIGSTSIRMGEQTGITFIALDDNLVQVQLAQGTISVRRRQYTPDDVFEVLNPNATFSIRDIGEYRLTAPVGANQTTIIVRSGKGVATGGGQDYTLASGQGASFSGTSSGQIAYDTNVSLALDEFDTWARQRDTVLNAVKSTQYVSNEVTGYQDLDTYGTWEAEPTYGQVWIPRGVAVGWAPYRNGHWVYVRPWGWTWMESEPWGFTPFHYGRWVNARNRWCWVPGARDVRPVYSPACVGFVGGGLDATITIGSIAAAVAWFPLGPRDVYIPPYHCSPRYVETINVTNTRIINRTYVNTVYVDHVNHRDNNIRYTYRENVQATTVVSRDTFVNARQVSTTTRVTVTQTDLRSPRIVRGAPIERTRAAVIGNSRVATGAALPPRDLDRRWTDTRNAHERDRGVIARPTTGRGNDDRGGSNNNDRGNARGNDRGNARGNDRGDNNARGGFGNEGRGNANNSDRGNARGNDRGNDRGDSNARGGFGNEGRGNANNNDRGNDRGGRGNDRGGSDNNDRGRGAVSTQPGAGVVRGNATIPRTGPGNEAITPPTVTPAPRPGPTPRAFPAPRTTPAPLPLGQQGRGDNADRNAGNANGRTGQPNRTITPGVVRQPDGGTTARDAGRGRVIDRSGAAGAAIQAGERGNPVAQPDAPDRVTINNGRGTVQRSANGSRFNQPEATRQTPPTPAGSTASGQSTTRGSGTTEGSSTRVRPNDRVTPTTPRGNVDRGGSTNAGGTARGPGGPASERGATVNGRGAETPQGNNAAPARGGEERGADRGAARGGDDRGGRGRGDGN